MFEEEMSGPGECVALDRGNRKKPPVLYDESHDQQGQSRRGADKMQAAGSPVGMFAEVKRIKLIHATVRLGFIHGAVPLLYYAH